tara:strand:- start:1302 stop:1850 length:549 start_codon:yes stop_codon:yes gene_type:complete
MISIIMGCILSTDILKQKSKTSELDESRYAGELRGIENRDINIEWKDTKPFTVPLNGGQVIKVYDGDTITIANKLPIYHCDELFRFSIRLNGIDTPEIKGKNEDEKEAAKVAKNALSEKILNKYVTLKNVANEKYGRVLADVYLGDLNLNNWMLENRFAVSYDGGTKIAPKSWKKYRETGEL